MNTFHLNVRDEFTRTPGARSRAEGKFSGEEFLEKFLLPKFEQAVRDGALLWINLDGSAGYATSFLEAAFGGLARRYTPELVRKHIRFISQDEPYLPEDIDHYISEAQAA